MGKKRTKKIEHLKLEITISETDEWDFDEALFVNADIISTDQKTGEPVVEGHIHALRITNGWMNPCEDIGDAFDEELYTLGAAADALYNVHGEPCCEVLLVSAIHMCDSELDGDMVEPLLHRLRFMLTGESTSLTVVTFANVGLDDDCICEIGNRRIPGLRSFGDGSIAYLRSDGLKHLQHQTALPLRMLRLGGDDF